MLNRNDSPEMLKIRDAIKKGDSEEIYQTIVEAVRNVSANLRQNLI